MKINFLVPEIVRSGGIRVIFEFANRLTDKGHDVVLYTPAIPFNKFRPGIKLYVVWHQFKYFARQFYGKPKLPLNIFPYRFKIKAIPGINNFFIRDSDAIFATSWPTSFHVAKLDISKGRKFYLIQDYEIWDSNKKLVDKSYTLPLSRIVVSQSLSKFLKSKFEVDSTLIRFGLDFTFWENTQKDYGRNPKTILFMDHPLKNKNSQTAVNVIRKLKKDYPEIRITAFGMDRFHDIPDYVDFHIDPEETLIRKLYSEADIYIYPTLNEGFGLPPAEAMACRCAVVANAVAAITEYTTNKENAILCDPANPTELYNGCSYLLENNSELLRISENGYISVRNFFDWESSITKLETLIEKSKHVG